jgi:hypothetical protein
MFKNLQLSEAELVAVLMTALDQGETDLVNALEFCAITGLDLLSLEQFTRANVKAFLFNDECSSHYVRYILNESTDVKVRMLEYIKGRGSRGTVFGPTKKLVRDFNRIRIDLGLGNYAFVIPETQAKKIESFCMSRQIQVVSAPHVYIANLSKKPTAEPMVFAFA